MILLTGANGVVGHPLSQKLNEQGLEFMSVSRHSGTNESTQHQLQWDLMTSLSTAQIGLLKGCDTLIHCAPIWLLAPHVPTLAAIGIKRMIVFSSTSVLSKKHSQDPSERLLVEQLLNGESSLIAYASSKELNFTILRPTLIYGYGRDQNITHIAKFIAKYKFMLLMGKAKGLRQPVHCDDLVTVCLSIINNKKTFNKVYNLAGAETLSYRQLVKKVFAGMKQTAIILSLPLFIFRFVLKLVSTLSSFSYTPEMANRMNQDLVYDISDAVKDFNYSPQGFLEQPKRDLPK